MEKKVSFTLNQIQAPGYLGSRSRDGFSYNIILETSEDLQSWEGFVNVVRAGIQQRPAPRVWHLKDAETGKTVQVCTSLIGPLRKVGNLYSADISFVPFQPEASVQAA